MNSGAFERHKWPKRHAHLVEECVVARRVLHVSDVLPHLGRGWQTQLIRSWSPPTHPGLTLVPRMGGPFRRWWFLCPTCERRCETLFVPPKARADDWRCRVCWDLIYASQRYGTRHPLRRVPAPRVKITRAKALHRQQRYLARLQAKQQTLWAELSRDDPDEDEEQLMRDTKRLDAYLEACENAAQQETADPVEAARRLLAVAREPSLAVLRQLAATSASASIRRRA